MEKAGLVQKGDKVYSDKFQGNQHPVTDKKAMTKAASSQMRLASINKYAGRAGGVFSVLAFVDALNKRDNGGTQDDFLIDIIKIGTPIAVGFFSAPAGLGVGSVILVNDVAKEYVIPVAQQMGWAVRRETTSAKGTTNLITSGMLEYYDFNFNLTK